MEGAPLTQEGICQVYQLIDFLSKEQSNARKTSILWAFLYLLFMFSVNVEVGWIDIICFYFIIYLMMLSGAGTM